MTHTATLENGTQVLIEHWPDGTLTIGCWTSTVEALRELIAGEDWPDADEHERLRRRPILSALADLCDAHIAYYGTNPLGSPTEAVKA